MLVWFSWIVVGIIYNLFHCYLFAYLNEDKHFKITMKILLLSLLFSLINYYTIINGLIIRPLVINICYVIIICFVYKPNISKSIISTLLIAFLLNISELIFVNIFLKTGILSQSYTINNANGIFMTNIIILSICFILFLIPKLRNLFRWIIKWYTDKKIINNILIALIAVVSIAIISYQNFGNDITKSYILTTNVFLISVIIFVIAYFRQKAYNSKLTIEYDKLMEYIKIYEELLNEKSKQQHEYKNQLILLKDMISIKNTDAIKYINDIIGISEKELEEEWLLKLKNVPQGGLKGLLYYKVMMMKEQGIEVYIDINNNLSDELVWTTCLNNLQDVSRVLGVYIDNAIEASLLSSKKFVIIEAELLDENIVFNISNTYKGSIDIPNIDSEGFSTKGKGKGYGLSLVKDIIAKNHNLRQQREINGIYYVEKFTILNEKCL